MKEIFNEFETDLKDLKPKVREKAIEIASGLLIKKNYTRQDALKEGIRQAEEWFLDLEG
ncbi:hypothetical protein [Pelobium manganitolerans]|uniref:hypothetical protein n=1 Tax=Pelobium manganitolerans TaxID=1842495 RepID=UPI0016024752|nr:hypothetical protein [Pelobium manganitolerans]